MKYVLIFFFCLSITPLAAGWSNINTGINDNFTGVVLSGNYGILSGHHGVYYTTTGATGSWTRYNIAGNAPDSLVYNSTKFTHAYSHPNFSATDFFVCGTDTVNSKAVIMVVKFPALTYSILYYGPVGTALNQIAFNTSNFKFLAVGDNGLIVKFDLLSSSIVPTTINSNLISVSGTNNYFLIGTNGALINANMSGSFTYTVNTTFSYDHSGVLCTGNNMGYSVGNSYYKWTGYGTDQPNFDYGSLNGRCIFSYNSSHFVGTDHGIFRSGSSYSFLEFQPSSAGYTINGFCYSSGMYACGNNGALLFSSDYGGVTKPYAKLSLTGGCKGSTIAINGITGTSSGCDWYINNNSASYACGGFNYVFPTAGQYTVQVNVSNGVGLYDTAVSVITIVDTPLINKPVSLSKNVLCKQEAITITIDSSQSDVFYSLKKFGVGNTVYGSSPAGNGSTISFLTSQLSAAGNYYLVSQSTLASCTRNFTDTIVLEVEKTTADFHQSKVNIEPGEQFICYEKCKDAQNYAWTFSSPATPSSSSSADPSVAFGSTGATQIKLVCWSNNGCYDSTTKTGPTVYVLPNNDDSCWTMVNNGVDPAWQGYYTEDIAQISPSGSGFFSCGYFNQEVFVSRYGNSLQAPFATGGYAIKYNNNGVIKWFVHSRQPAGVRDQINAVVENSNKEIYISGYRSGAFYDNAGDSVPVSYSNSNGYLAKLDSSGKLIWMLSGMNFIPSDITLDKSGNILLPAWIGASVIPFSLNGIPAYTISNTASPLWNYCMLKVSPGGNILWHAGLHIAFVNQGAIVKLGADQNNNIYMAGIHEQYVRLYSAGSSSYTTVNGFPGNYGGKTFLAKYDSTGLLQWSTRSYTPGPSNDATIPMSMVTDDNGNCYISGKNSCYYSGYSQVFENTNATTTSFSTGEYFVMKVNSSGICQWINGAKYSYYGNGQKITMLGDQLTVIGTVSQNPTTTPATVTFTSANNDTLNLTINSKDYFLAVYDTAGNIKYLRVNGVNSPTISDFGFTGFFQRSDSSYYVGRNISISNGVTYNNFGTLLGATNGRDGTITKISGDCGITVLPSSLTTGIEGNSEETITLYPNPNNGEFVIECKDSLKARIEIVDALGRKVSGFSTSHFKGAISVSNLSSGFYSVCVITDHGQTVKKIVVQQ